MNRPTAGLAVLAEKVIATYVQALIALLLLDGALDINGAESAAIAAIPAALTVIANGLPLVPHGLPFYADLAMRVIRTFVAGFLGTLIAMPVFRLDRSALLAAAAGAIPAVLALIKGGLASRVGDTDSAALLPIRLTRPAELGEAA
jgi:hypothetical protein